MRCGSAGWSNWPKKGVGKGGVDLPPALWVRRTRYTMAGRRWRFPHCDLPVWEDGAARQYLLRRAAKHRVVLRQVPQTERMHVHGTQASEAVEGARRAAPANGTGHHALLRWAVASAAPWADGV